MLGLGLGIGKCAQESCECAGCFGGITTTECELSWTTTGDPVAVRLRRNGVTVSDAAVGRIFRPEFGTYDLEIKCQSAEEEWTLIDQKLFGNILPGRCTEGCCRRLGYTTYSSPEEWESATIPVRVSFDSEPWNSIFAGTYATKRGPRILGANPCAFGATANYPSVTLPYAIRQSPGEPCQKVLASTLFQFGLNWGEVEFSFSAAGERQRFEVWLYPLSDSGIGVELNNVSQSHGMQILAQFRLCAYLIKTSQPFTGTCTSDGVFYVPCLGVTVGGVPVVLSCGSSSYATEGGGNVPTVFDQMPWVTKPLQPIPNPKISVSVMV